MIISSVSWHHILHNFLSTEIFCPAAKAIDLLLDSKWAVKQKGETDALFTTRESVVDFMERLLRHKMFHRAKVVVVQKSDVKKKKGDEESAAEEPSKKSKKSKENNDGNESEKKDDDSKKEKGEKRKKAEKKGKKKIKLDMHMEQIFVDGKEVKKLLSILFHNFLLMMTFFASPMFGSTILSH